MGYSAGNLELSILGFSEKAVSSIDVTAKALRKLASAVNKINNTQFVFAGQKLEVLFSKIANATNSINTTNITNLASATKSLSSISKLSNLEKMDFEKVGKGFSTLTVAITPFIAKVKEAETSLNSLYGILSKSSGKKISSLLDTSTPKSSKKSGINTLLNIGKWGAILYTARRLGRVVGDIAQKGADYTETLNLWQVAMGDNLGIATEFVNKMNEAYGVSEKTLMNAQAIFKNMLGSLGEISDQMAYSLSEGVTQMALDYASLYNQTFEQAFTKFQAALAGQVRPIRSVAGYDITENTLFQLYQSLGGTKTMRQLSRTEKQLLSILAIFNQMEASGAIGDLDKTMESFANQSRVAAESFQEILSYSGILLTYGIEQLNLMVYLNAALIFAGDLLKAIANDLGAIKSYGDPFASITEGATEASDAYDEIQGKLLDFDKFRSLSTSEDENLGLDKKLIDAMSNYNSILENADMEARQLAEQWKEITFWTDGAFDKKKLKEFYEDLKPIFALISGASIFKMLFNPSMVFSKFFLILSGLVLGFLYLTNEDFRDTINNVFSWLTTKLQNIDWNAIGEGIAYQINNIDWAQVGEDLAIVIENAFELLGALGNGLAQALESAIDNIDWGKFWQECWNALVAIDAKAKETEQKTRKKIWDDLGLTDFFNDIAGAFNPKEEGSLAWAIWEGLKWLGKGFKWVAGGGGKWQTFADGGLPDKGTMFIAGEAGAEMVYNMPNGQSGVANISQIKSAFYQALVEYGKTESSRSRPIEVYLDGELVYQNTTAHAKQRGNVWGKA